jgi:hypothetical protein
MQILSGSGTLGAILLRYAKLLLRELSDRLVALDKLSHLLLFRRDLFDGSSYNVTPNVGAIDTQICQHPRQFNFAMSRYLLSAAVPPGTRYISAPGCE